MAAEYEDEELDLSEPLEVESADRPSTSLGRPRGDHSKYITDIGPLDKNKRRDAKCSFCPHKYKSFRPEQIFKHLSDDCRGAAPEVKDQTRDYLAAKHSSLPLQGPAIKRLRREAKQSASSGKASSSRHCMRSEIKPGRRMQRSSASTSLSHSPGSCLLMPQMALILQVPPGILLGKGLVNLLQPPLLQILVRKSSTLAAWCKLFRLHDPEDDCFVLIYAALFSAQCDVWVCHACCFVLHESCTASASNWHVSSAFWTCFWPSVTGDVSIRDFMV